MVKWKNKCKKLKKDVNYTENTKQRGCSRNRITFIKKMSQNTRLSCIKKNKNTKKTKNCLQSLTLSMFVSLFLSPPKLLLPWFLHIFLIFSFLVASVLGKIGQVESNFDRCRSLMGMIGVVGELTTIVRSGYFCQSQI